MANTSVRDELVDPDGTETKAEAFVRMLEEGIPQQDIAVEIGVSPRTLTRWGTADVEVLGLMREAERRLAKKSMGILERCLSKAATNVYEAVENGDVKASIWLLTQANIPKTMQDGLGTRDSDNDGSKNAITIEVNTAASTPSSNAGNTVLHATRDAEVVQDNEHSSGVIDTSVVNDKA